MEILIFDPTANGARKSVSKHEVVIPWDACGTPTVKIRFGCTQNCKASQ